MGTLDRILPGTFAHLSQLLSRLHLSILQYKSFSLEQKMTERFISNTDQFWIEFIMWITWWLIDLPINFTILCCRIWWSSAKNSTWKSVERRSYNFSDRSCGLYHKASDYGNLSFRIQFERDLVRNGCIFKGRRKCSARFCYAYSLMQISSPTLRVIKDSTFSPPTAIRMFNFTPFPLPFTVYCFLC